MFSTANKFIQRNVMVQTDFINGYNHKTQSSVKYLIFMAYDLIENISDVQEK